jgi:hypothetical protein
MIDYYRRNGGSLADEGEFGVDPIRNCEDLINVRQMQCLLNYDDIFADTVNGKYLPFRDGLLRFIDKTLNLSPSN